MLFLTNTLCLALNTPLLIFPIPHFTNSRSQTQGESKQLRTSNPQSLMVSLLTQIRITMTSPIPLHKHPHLLIHLLIPHLNRLIPLLHHLHLQLLSLPHPGHPREILHLLLAAPLVSLLASPGLTGLKSPIRFQGPPGDSRTIGNLHHQFPILMALMTLRIQTMRSSLKLCPSRLTDLSYLWSNLWSSHLQPLLWNPSL